VFGLLFRSLIWASWVPYGDDPYGPSDILELLIWYLVLGLCTACAVIGALVAAIPRIRDLRVSSKLLITGVVLPVAYYIAHAHVPVFALWG
jgi:hypothetical protein